MALTARLTEEEFDRRYAGERAEFVDGEVVLLAAAESRRSEDVRWFLGDLMRFAARQTGGRVYGPNYTLRLRPGLQRLPDILYVVPEREQHLHPTRLEGPPDLAVEIVSQDSVPRDWREKHAEYEAHGVREYLIVDPLSQRCELNRLGESGYAVVDPADGWLVSTVLPGFRFRPEWLWQEPLPDVVAVLHEIGLL